MKIIGLTGNSGSGKSSVSALLKERGARIIDADIISRQVLMPGEPAYLECVNAFGQGILMPDGSIDRGKLGDIVFADEAKRQTLIAITHKHIVRAMKRQALETLEDPKGAAAVVFDAPLLIEANLHALCDDVWVVTAPRDAMLRRIMARDNLTAEQAENRLSSQPTREKFKQMLAGHCFRFVENDGDLKRLKQIIDDYDLRD